MLAHLKKNNCGHLCYSVMLQTYKTCTFGAFHPLFWVPVTPLFQSKVSQKQPKPLVSVTEEPKWPQGFIFFKINFGCFPEIFNFFHPYQHLVEGSMTTWVTSYRIIPWSLVPILGTIYAAECKSSENRVSWAHLDDFHTLHGCAGGYERDIHGPRDSLYAKLA